MVASYLKDYVRPRLRSLVGDHSLWGWEEFKARRSRELFKTKRRLSSSAGIVLVLRSMLFVVPSLGSIIAVVALSISKGLLHARMFGHFVPALFVLWFAFDLLIVSALILHLRARTDLPERLVEPNAQPEEPKGAGQSPA